MVGNEPEALTDERWALNCIHDPDWNGICKKKRRKKNQLKHLFWGHSKRGPTEPQTLMACYYLARFCPLSELTIKLKVINFKKGTCHAQPRAIFKAIYNSQETVSLDNTSRPGNIWIFIPQMTELHLSSVISQRTLLIVVEKFFLLILYTTVYFCLK